MILREMKQKIIDYQKGKNRGTIRIYSKIDTMDDSKMEEEHDDDMDDDEEGEEEEEDKKFDDEDVDHKVKMSDLTQLLEEELTMNKERNFITLKQKILRLFKLLTKQSVFKCVELSECEWSDEIKDKSECNHHEISHIVSECVDQFNQKMSKKEDEIDKLDMISLFNVNGQEFEKKFEQIINTHSGLNKENVRLFCDIIREFDIKSIRKHQKCPITPIIRLNELLNNHLQNGLNLFIRTAFIADIKLSDFFTKHIDKIMENYYWKFLSKSNKISNPFFEIAANDPDIEHVNTLKNGQECWAKLGDFIRNSPNGYKILVINSKLQLTEKDYKTTLTQTQLQLLFNSFALNFFRYDTWNWNNQGRKQKEIIIQNHIKQIVEYLIEDQQHKQDEYQLNIDSFLYDENICNIFITYQFQLNYPENNDNNNKKNKNKHEAIIAIGTSEITNFEQKEEEDEDKPLIDDNKAVQLIPINDRASSSDEEEVKEMKYNLPQKLDALNHISVFSSNVSEDCIFHFFAFPENQNEIKFRTSHIPNNGSNQMFIKFCENIQTSDQCKHIVIDEKYLKTMHENDDKNRWFVIKRDGKDISINDEAVSETKTEIENSAWIGIAYLTENEVNEHIVISSNDIEPNIIKSWKQQKHLQDIEHSNVLLIDNINSERDDWFQGLTNHIYELFDSNNDNDNNNRDIKIRKLEGISLYPKCDDSVEIRTKYKIPPKVLQEALRIDFSIKSILGTDYIIINQTVYDKITMHQNVYNYINNSDILNETDNVLLNEFAEYVIYNEDKKESSHIHLATNKPDQNDLITYFEKKEEQKKEEKTEIKIEEKEHENMISAFSFKEICEINTALSQFIEMKFMSLENSKSNDGGDELNKLKEIQNDLHSYPIWPWISVILKRDDTLKKGKSLTNNGNLAIRSIFSTNTAILSDKPLPLIAGLNVSQRTFYYEMNIDQTGTEISICCGFANIDSINKIGSTSIPGRIPATFGLGGNKGQLLISNTEKKTNYLPIPFDTKQIIGNRISIENNKFNQRRSYIMYNFMRGETSKTSLDSYPDITSKASLQSREEQHSYHSFLSIGSRHTLISINHGPRFQDETVDDYIMKLLQFDDDDNKEKQSWHSDEIERKELINKIYAGNNNNNELQKIQKVNDEMQGILLHDLKRLTEVLLNIQMAKEFVQQNQQKQQRLNRSISKSLYLYTVLHYLLFINELNKINDTNRREMHLGMGLNECAKNNFKFNNPITTKILKLENQMKRPKNRELLKIINKYGLELKQIDKNIKRLGIRDKTISNLSEEDVPFVIKILGKYSNNKLIQENILKLYKMMSQDRLLNVDEASDIAIKQEFLCDILSCYLSKNNFLNLLKEIIQNWSYSTQNNERYTSSFSYDYELKILISGFIRGSRNPVLTCIQCAIYLRQYSEVFPGIEQDLIDLNLYCQEYANNILSGIDSNRLKIICLEANECLGLSLNEDIDTFICGEQVQNLRSFIWISPSDQLLIDGHSAETFHDTDNELLQWISIFFGPYINMFNSWGNLRDLCFSTKVSRDWFFSPAGKEQFETIVTILHVILTIAVAVQLQTVFDSSEEMSGLEITFHIVNLSFFLSEINQIIFNKRYWKETGNLFDLVSIVGYMIIFVLRVLVTEQIVTCQEPECCTNPVDEGGDDSDIICEGTCCIDTNYNVFYLFIWFIILMSMCSRLCVMLFVFKSMGLMVKSMINMIVDIANFILFLVIFILGFSVILLMATGDQEGYNKLYDSLLSMTYGMLDGLDNGDFYGQYDNPYRNVFITAIVFIYVVLAVVILLNFIIAVMSTTYEDIVEQSEIFVNKHRMKITYSRYDLPTLPPPFQIISVLIRIFIIRIIEPLILYCFCKKKRFNYSWSILKKQGIKINVGNDNKSNQLFMKKFNGFLINDRDLNYWICNYCLCPNCDDNDKNDKKTNDLERYYKMNEDIQPDFAFRDSDIQFLQSMNIELCDNCFRPQNKASRKLALESIISFWIYHILSFLIIRLPISIIIITVAFCILFPFLILPAMISLCFACCCLCCCSSVADKFTENKLFISLWVIMGKILDWFHEGEQVEYEVRIMNPAQIYRAFIKNNKKKKKINTFDKTEGFIKEFVYGYLFHVFKDNNLTNMAQRSRTKTTPDIDRIGELFRIRIKEKRLNEPIILISNVDWQTALNLLNGIQTTEVITEDDNNIYDKYLGICECVIEPCRVLLKFDDIDSDQNASQQTRKDYHFTNSPVLNRIQSID